MAYFTGKDVDVWITTEHMNDYIEVTDNELVVNRTSATSLTEAREDITSDALFSGALGNAGSTVNRLTDLTGVDVSVGASDEDLNFFGLRNVGKIEIKKDTSVTITRKKSNNKNLIAFQGTTASADSKSSGAHGARWGLVYDDDTKMVLNDATVDPKSALDDTSNQCYGYRVFVELKGESASGAGDGTVLVIPNCTMMDYSGSVSNDSANEETFTFSSMVKPKVMNSEKTNVTTSPSAANDYFGTAAGAGVGFVTQTAAADM